MDAVAAFDKSLFLAINGSSGAPWLDQIMLVLSAHLTWLVVAVVAIAFAVVRRSRRGLVVCLLVAIAIALSDLFAFQVLKPYFARLRPCHMLADLVRLVQSGCGGDFGFPSNHAANAMAAATVLVLAGRRSYPWTWSLLLLAGLIGLSRIYLGAHYPGDVLAGFLLGAAIGWGTYTAYGTIKDRRSGRKPG